MWARYPYVHPLAVRRHHHRGGPGDAARRARAPAAEATGCRGRSDVDSSRVVDVSRKLRRGRRRSTACRWRSSAGRIYGPHRPQRLRQDHALQLHHRPRAPGQRASVRFDGRAHRRLCALAHRAAGYRPDVPGHPRVSRADRAGELAGGHARRARATPSGARRQMLEFVKLERLADEYAGNLSYGQQKLVEFVRVLMTRSRADPARRAGGRRESHAAQRSAGRREPPARRGARPSSWSSTT